MSGLRFFADTMHALIAAERAARDAGLQREIAVAAIGHHESAAQRLADETMRAQRRPTTEWHRMTAEVAAARAIRLRAERAIKAHREAAP